jgi:hypothetical protein
LILLLAAFFPMLLWDRGPETAPDLKSAGIDRIAVPSGTETSWGQADWLKVRPVDVSALVKLLTPGVEYRINEASASTVPWLNANGWRLQREPSAQYLYEVHGRSAALAAAEAAVYGGTTFIHADNEALRALATMFSFLRSLPQRDGPALANIGVVDDGSAKTGEMLNLLARYNLLFQVLQRPDPKLDLNVRIGTGEYPEEEANNPQRLAIHIRGNLGDDRRLLRIYGSQVVIGRLTGANGQVRLHLLNYGGRPVQGIRVLVKGRYRRSTVLASGISEARLIDYSVESDRTEFTLPLIDTYAVVDLSEQ